MSSQSDHERPERPRPGDVLIAKDSDMGYILSVAPGEPQLRHPTYELALSQAKAWASLQRVAVWYTQDRETFVQLEPGTGAPGQTRRNRAADS